MLGFDFEETPTKIDALPQIQTKGFSQFDLKTLGNNSQALDEDVLKEIDFRIEP
jgi:hypothetical protein